ncbi:hypothetical protein GCM10010389_21450 [Streptomyces echinoruber]|uniref:SDR family NAD(P)-dependent oxidoreductase n=1 Tax=Streptomyces echinoruber TaxID=68898 RepID=A0A918R1P8_9ACTN|nr:hypothetical protein GCM10010389_21450 [Streptomyces echinoruber]
MERHCGGADAPTSRRADEPTRRRADAYACSKFSLAAFTFDLADELQATGVHVDCAHVAGVPPTNFMDAHQTHEAGLTPWTSAAAGVEPGSTSRSAGAVARTACLRP